jgi:hypothetical protein
VTFELVLFIILKKRQYMRKIIYNISFLSVHKLTELALSYFHLIENWHFKGVPCTLLMNNILYIYLINSTYEKIRT